MTMTCIVTTRYILTPLSTVFLKIHPVHRKIKIQTSPKFLYLNIYILDNDNLNGFDQAPIACCGGAYSQSWNYSTILLVSTIIIIMKYNVFFRFPGQELINQLQDTTYSIYVILVFDIILFILTLFHFGTASTIDPGIIPR